MILSYNNSLNSCLGYEALTVGSGAAVSLAGIPSNAKTALITLEANAGTVNKDRAVRFTIDGVIVPTAVIGVCLGDNDTLELNSRQQLNGLKLIGIDVGLNHSLKIVYFG